MKAEHVNSFYVAAQDVFKLMLDLDVKRGELSLVNGLAPSKDANIMLGIVGDLEGAVSFSFPKEMALEMVKIMAGMEIDDIDVFVSSALGEVANIIGGNAITNLSNYDIKCDITPPQIIIGKHKSISIVSENVLVIPMNTDIGMFDMSIFL